MSFALRLKELRTSKNMTQGELSKALNISQSAIAMYESGRREPKIEILEIFADYFNVDMNYITGKSNLTTKIESPTPPPTDNVTTDYLLGRTDEPGGTGFQKGLLGDTTQDSHIVMTSNTLGDSDTDDIQRRYSQLDEAGKAAVKNLMSIFENAKKTN